ncbi:hypothetical protein [Kluyvera sp. CHPC 1.251]|uniref:hypothetical protein n=1 Tax=Kluyvera sp. CHPC 1.251 TaxID=2995175 RepID=UPI002FD862FB
MATYVFSPSNLAFFPVIMLGSYLAAGWDLSDAVEVSDDVYREFSAEKEGNVLGVVDGMPAWIEKPPYSNSDLLKNAIIKLNFSYQGDIEVLNRAWLAAAVNDGVNETSKKDAVLVQINARKAAYETDRAEIIAQYPV